MVKFIEKIKKVFTKKNVVLKENKANHFAQNVIPNIRFGAIILSKNSENNINAFDRDILVAIGKTNNALLCCFCDTIDKHNVDDFLRNYQLFDENGNIVTSLSFRNINKESFEKVLGSLSSEDSNLLVKNLKYNLSVHKQVLSEPNLKLLFNPLTRIRDIVKKGEEYYLVLNSVSNVDKFSPEISNERFLLLPINNYVDNNITCDSVRFDQATMLNCDDYDLKYIDTVSKSTYGPIVKKYYRCIFRKNELLKVKNNKILKKGYIILYNDKYYYVYEVSGKANAFEINICDTADGIRAGNTKFIPLFDNKCKIDIKNDIYKFIDVAYFDETFAIEEAQNKYYESRLINNKKMEGYSFKTGDVVEHSNCLNLKYIVIGVRADKLITICFKPFIEHGNIEYNEFIVGDVNLVLSNSVSKKELTIIRDNLNVFNVLYDDVRSKKKTLTNKV